VVKTMDARSSEPTVDRFKHVLQDQGLRGQSAARGGRVIPIRLWWSAHQARSIAGTIPHPTMRLSCHLENGALFVSMPVLTTSPPPTELDPSHHQSGLGRPQTAFWES